MTTAQATRLFAEDRCSNTDISEICVYFCRFRLETAMMNIEQAFQSQGMNWLSFTQVLSDVPITCS